MNTYRAIRDAPRSRQSYNAIGDAIDHFARLIAAAPWAEAQKVIDIASDGPDHLRSLRPAALARDEAVAVGITINALAIELSPLTRFSLPLRAHCERDVTGGPGVFVMTVEIRRDFARAMRAKLVREIAARPAGKE